MAEWAAEHRDDKLSKHKFNREVAIRRLVQKATSTLQGRLVVLMATLAAPLPSLERGEILGVPEMWARFMLLHPGMRGAAMQRDTVAIAVMAKAFAPLAVAVAGDRARGMAVAAPAEAQ
jgi:hypothetical protein